MDKVDIDLENMMKTYEDVLEEGKEFSNSFNSIRNIVIQIKKYWKAKSYNDFARYFNSEINNIKIVIDFSKNKIPATINNIMQSYAIADKQNQYKKIFQSEKINYIEVEEFDSNEEININTTEIENYINEFKKELSNAKTSIKNINTSILNVVWYGELARELKNDIKKNIDNIMEYLDNFNKNIEICLNPIYNMIEAQKNSYNI